MKKNEIKKLLLTGIISSASLLLMGAIGTYPANAETINVPPISINQVDNLSTQSDGIMSPFEESYPLLANYNSKANQARRKAVKEGYANPLDVHSAMYYFELKQEKLSYEQAEVTKNVVNSLIGNPNVKKISFSNKENKLTYHLAKDAENKTQLSANLEQQAEQIGNRYGLKNLKVTVK